MQNTKISSGVGEDCRHREEGPEWRGLNEKVKGRGRGSSTHRYSTKAVCIVVRSMAFRGRLSKFKS